MPIDAQALQACLAVLEAARELPPDDPQLRALEQATAHLRKSAKRARKRERAVAAKQGDRAKLDTCTRVREWDGRTPTESGEPEPQTLHHEQRCYVCKQPYRELHHFYHLLCPGCAAHNWAARERRVDLSGRRALVTGGRVKIGFELCLKLLRDGAELLVVTRFPHDAQQRFAAVADYAAFADRLRLIGLDLRYLPGVIELCDHLLGEGRALDILVNNAAQTIWRPPAWYRDLAHAELALAPSSDAALLPTSEAAASFLAEFHASCRNGDQTLFPSGARDEEGKQLDLRARNSWVLELQQVDAIELVEAQLVNAIAPALLCARLRPLLDRSGAPDRHVVNVTAVEGRFDYQNKTARHPHTNMAKAALNMLTRTCAESWAAARIYINSVDTGWITQENPEPIKRKLADGGFRPPLDLIDGAARIYDPIVRGVAGEPIWGAFLKDYRPASW
jgi:NAD(P)-dependent dehydrogenase (short-subunit alcohol dehydrogenase family)